VTKATTGSSLNELRRRVARRAPALQAAPPVEIDRFYDHPLYLDALAGCVRRGLDTFPEERRPHVTVLFSAHGLPRSFVRRGDPYVEHLLHTIAGVMARLAAADGRLQPWRLSYQSRVGKDWLEPGTEQTLAELARTGPREVLAVPISFVCDHIETLYEIDLLFGEEAARLGLDFRRAPSLNTDPTFIEALAALVEHKLR
jgi:ferrochelatase